MDSEDGGVFMHPVSQSSLVVEIKEKQVLDPDLMKIKSNVGQHKVVDFVINGDGILRYQGRLCVLNIDRLKEKVMVEVHGARYSIYPSSTKIYHKLREFY